MTTLGTRGSRRGRAGRPARGGAPARTAAGRSSTTTRRSTGAARTAGRSTTGTRAGAASGRTTATRSTAAGRGSTTRGVGTARRSSAGRTATTVRTRARQAAARRSPTRSLPAVRNARSSRRLRLVLLTYLVITLALGWRLIDIQVLSAPTYRERARAQTERELALPAERGKVYDRSGEPLAISLPTATVVANPKQIADAEGEVDVDDLARQLSAILPMPTEDIALQLRRKDRGFIYLARQQPHDLGERVEALGLVGISVLDEPRRQYPAGTLASQIVGFAGTDNVGLSGLEQQYDTLLAGMPGRMVAQRAPQGLEISSAPRVGEPPVAGTDLVLTLDSEVQATTERLLADAVKETKAQGASAVVLDVRTGEILSMASLPSYDPEAIGDATGYERRNRTVTDAYEPGSVNKAITAAAALEEGVVTPKTKIRIGSSYTVSGKTFTDSHTTDRAALPEIIQYSSNIGTIKLAQRLGPDLLHEYLQRFGYGQQTALGFPGETGGMLADPADWSGTSLPTMAIGHGVSTSLLQVAQVYATIARGGEYRDPVLVRGTVGADGELQPSARGEQRRVVSQRTAELVSEMLVSVVDDGTGTNAQVAGYQVAGKTGTAQKPAEDRAGYESGAYVGSFAGFAPADRPEVVVAVAVDEPKAGYYGGTVAAPVFADLVRFTLGHRRVPPSETKDAEAPDPDV